MRILIQNTTNGNGKITLSPKAIACFLVASSLIIWLRNLQVIVPILSIYKCCKAWDKN